MIRPLYRVGRGQFKTPTSKKPIALILRDGGVSNDIHVLIGCYNTPSAAELARDEFRRAMGGRELWPAEQFSIVTSDRLAPVMDL